MPDDSWENGAAVACERRQWPRQYRRRIPELLPGGLNRCDHAVFQIDRPNAGAQVPEGDVEEDESGWKCLERGVIIAPTTAVEPPKLLKTVDTWTGSNPKIAVGEGHIGGKPLARPRPRAEALEEIVQNDDAHDDADKDRRILNVLSFSWAPA